VFTPLITNQRSEHRGDSDKTNQRSEHRGDSDKTNQRSEYMGDSDKVNQRSYWNTWVILIKQIPLICFIRITAVFTPLIYFITITPVFTPLICFIRITSVFSSDLFFSESPLYSLLTGVILIKQIREEHSAVSDKINQRSYWNTWVILIKQIRGEPLCSLF
jgi:hypothetical protein